MVIFFSVKKVTLDYRFEEECALRFEVYDIDNPSATLDLHDFIGFAECTLGQIVAAGYSGLTLPLTQKKSRFNPKGPKQTKQSSGRIILTAEELVQFKEEVSISAFYTTFYKGVCLLTYLSAQQNSKKVTRM